jgi:hypothetical protein
MLRLTALERPRLRPGRGARRELARRKETVIATVGDVFGNACSCGALISCSFSRRFQRPTVESGKVRVARGASRRRRSDARPHAAERVDSPDEPWSDDRSLKDEELMAECHGFKGDRR